MRTSAWLSATSKPPDGHGRLELFESLYPDAFESGPTRPNEIGMHRVASVDDIDEGLEIAAELKKNTTGGTDS